MEMKPKKTKPKGKRAEKELGVCHVKDKKLTPKERLFIKSYLAEFNAGKSVVESGYKTKQPYQYGSALLRKAHIQAAIQKELSERFQKLDLTVDMVLRELSFSAFIDPAKVVDENNMLLGVHKIPEDTRRAIAAIKNNADGSVEYKFNNKTTSLELLGKYLKLWTDKIESTGKDGGPIEVKMTGGPPDTDTLDDWLAAKAKIDEAYKK